MIDHIIFDGWSYGVLISELNAFYNASLAGYPDPLPPLEIEYYDVAAWQRRHLTGARYERLLGYWQNYLRGPLSLIELTSDRPRSFKHGVQLGIYRFSLSAGLSKSIRTFSRSHSLSTFMTLTAALQTWLARISGEPDVSIVTPIANRPLRAMRPLIGPFNNPVIIRTPPTERAALPLDKVRANCLASLSHGAMPFGTLMDDLQSRGCITKRPFFPAMLVLQNYPTPPFAMHGLEVCERRIYFGGSSYDFTFIFVDFKPELEGQLEFNAALFSSATARYYFDAFRGFLEEVVA
jgi:hypothetical protein